MTDKVQCTGAGKEWCGGCYHEEPHEPFEDHGKICTKWTDCGGKDGNGHNVRCVKVKEGEK